MNLIDLALKVSRTEFKDELETEVKRAQTIQGISAEIIKAHATQLDAVKLVAQYKGLNQDQQAPRIALGDMDVEV